MQYNSPNISFSKFLNLIVNEPEISASIINKYLPNLLDEFFNELETKIECFLSNSNDNFLKKPTNYHNMCHDKEKKNQPFFTIEEKLNAEIRDSISKQKEAMERKIRNKRNSEITKEAEQQNIASSNTALIGICNSKTSNQYYELFTNLDRKNLNKPQEKKGIENLEKTQLNIELMQVDNSKVTDSNVSTGKDEFERLNDSKVPSPLTIDFNIDQLTEEEYSNYNQLSKKKTTEKNDKNDDKTKIKNTFEFLKTFNPKFLKKENIDKIIIRKYRKYLKLITNKNELVALDYDKDFLSLFTSKNCLPPMSIYFHNEMQSFKSFNSKYMLWLFSQKGVSDLYNDFTVIYSAELLSKFISKYNLNYEESEKNIIGKLKHYIFNLNVFYRPNPIKPKLKSNNLSLVSTHKNSFINSDGHYTDSIDQDDPMDYENKTLKISFEPLIQEIGKSVKHNNNQINKQ